MMKKLKCGLFGIVSILGICCFCSSSYSIVAGHTQSIKANNTFSYNAGVCFYATSKQSAGNWYFRLTDNTVIYSGSIEIDSFYCFSDTGYVQNMKGSLGTLKYIYFNSSCPVCQECPSCPSCPTCPEINTGEILSGYILESEIDNLYCENHGYCPLINSGDIIGTGDNWSALFINEIQHPSAPLINITIPEEFDWTYTGDDEEYNVDIKGFNVDTEYIDGIIRNQTTLPNKTDFNNTISGLIPLLVPGLVVIMFFIFIFRFIKKIF